MSYHELLFCLIQCFFGFTCYNMANKIGRNKWLGLIGGILFGLGSIVYYLIVGKYNFLIAEGKEEKRKEIQKEFERLDLIIKGGK